jgi:hypothetical protein
VGPQGGLLPLPLPQRVRPHAGFAHPVNVYLREADLLPKLDTWLARLVSPANIEATCRRLVAAFQPTGQADPDLRAAQPWRSARRSATCPGQGIAGHWAARSWSATAGGTSPSS